MVSTSSTTPSARQAPTSGYTESADRLGSTAAPLLAGFAITLLGLIVSDINAVRWPDPTLAVLSLAVVLLMVSMQLFISGRQFHLGDEEFKAYTPTLDEGARRAAHEAANSVYRQWVKRSRLAFNTGLVLFLLATAGVLVPPDNGGDLEHEVGRWIAVAIMLGACLVEAVWIVRGEWSASRWNRQVESQQDRSNPRT